MPYGVLNPRNKWDNIIPFDDMWFEFNRISKKNTAVITTAKQPFTSQLIMSNLKDFRYTLVWEKSKATGYLNSKRMPLVAHEDIVVFYNHPTQKPIKLFEWLIKMYSNENDVVLDPTMGSGSTGISCINTNRNFIGIELDKKYFKIFKNRIEKTIGINKFTE